MTLQSQMLNSTLDSTPDPGLAISIFVISPEIVCFFLLAVGVYAMYNGIEIQHPLYAILFFNLVVPLVRYQHNKTFLAY